MNRRERLEWLRDAYARDAITLGCYEWLVEGVLTNDPQMAGLFEGPMETWPADPRETGVFAYDA